tara:strand:+ start:47 stop:589 length:543 start_codon:yes stop_codon:yes gene_type:complete
MQKYVEVDVQDQVVAGQTTNDQTGNNKLEDNTENFTTLGVAVGDIVHDTTDDRMYTVAAIDSNTVLSLTPIGAATGTGLDTGKDYIIYNASSSSKQLIATDGVALVENAAADPINSEVNIQYCGANGIAIKITHAAVAAGNEEMRDGFQEAMEASLIQAWPLVKYSSWLPSSLILEVNKI